MLTHVSSLMAVLKNLQTFLNSSKMVKYHIQISRKI